MNVLQSDSRLPLATRPKTVQVKPRNLNYRLGESVPRHWFDNDPFLTQFMNALSITFPHGEKQFISSVKAVRDRVTNPAIRADIAGFVAQEALHSREHGALNSLLEKMGYPAEQLENEFGEHLRQRVAGQSEKMALAMTVAIEHLTAVFGRMLLTDATFREQIHPEMRPMWIWHAIEEIEHKAVAFDVYQDVFADDRLRAVALFLGTFAFFSFSHYAQYKLLKRDGLANNPLVWAKGLWRMWGPRGMLPQVIPGWLAFLRPGFHPWQEDDSALIAEFEASIQPRALAS